MMGKETQANGDPHAPSDHQQSPSAKSKVIDFLQQNGLVLATLVGIAIGAGLGFGLRTVGLSDHALMWIGRFHLSVLFLLLLSANCCCMLVKRGY